MHISVSLCIKSRGCSHIIAISEQFLKGQITPVYEREITGYMGRERKSHKKTFRKFATTQKDHSNPENEDLHLRMGHSVPKTLREKIKREQGLHRILLSSHFALGCLICMGCCTLVERFNTCPWASGCRGWYTQTVISPLCQDPVSSHWPSLTLKHNTGEFRRSCYTKEANLVEVQQSGWPECFCQNTFCICQSITVACVQFALVFRHRKLKSSAEPTDQIKYLAFWMCCKPHVSFYSDHQINIYWY